MSADNSPFSQDLNKMNDIAFFNEEMILSESFNPTLPPTSSTNDSRGESNPNDEEITPEDMIKGQNATMS